MGPGQIQVWQREFEPGSALRRGDGGIPRHRQGAVACVRRGAAQSDDAARCEAGRHEACNSRRPASDGGRRGTPVTSGDRVVWSEGMFLRTQHFQQQDRWVEAYVQGARRRADRPWLGLSRLELNTGLLTTGQDRGRYAAEGRLPDGTPFSIPDGPIIRRRCRPPRPRARGSSISACQRRQPGAAEIDADGTAGDRGRHARSHRSRSRI